MLRPRHIVLAFVLVLVPLVAAAQTDCETGDGPLRSDQPDGITPTEIIQRFTAGEATLKGARDDYIYTQDVTVQTLHGRHVESEYKKVSEITYSATGGREEVITYAPQPTLARISVSPDDFRRLREEMTFVLTPDVLPDYAFIYLGRQRVDDVETYVFEVTPRHAKKGKRSFQGRVWVIDHDFQIVKTCGKFVPEETGPNAPHAFPRWVSYREPVDGKFYFPVYVGAEDNIPYANQDITAREVIKYRDYRRVASHTAIVFDPAAQKH